MSSVPKIPFEALPQTLADALRPRVKRLGYFGEFFQYAAHQPEALLAFNQFTEAGKGGLPDKLVELVALTCAGWMDNAYERHQHERLCVRLGYGRDWVAAVNALDSNHNGLSDDERLVQMFLLTVLDSRGHEAGPMFERVVAALGPAGAIAVLMVLGRYVVHGLFVNTLGLAPPVPSIFEDGFAG